MNKPIGGRGKTAPYISTHVRIPEELKPYIEFIKERYYDGKLETFESFVNLFNDQLTSSSLQQIESLQSKLTQNEETINCQKKWIEQLSNSSLTTLTNAQDYADSLIKQKKSARVCLSKLLEFIYGKS